MKSSLARLLRRRRGALVDACARPLARVFTAERAHIEAASLVDGIAASLLHADAMGTLDRVRLRFDAWRRAGAGSDVLLGVLVALARPARLRDAASAAPAAAAPAAEAPLALSLAREVREKERFAALLTVSRAVGSSLDLDTLLATIAKQVREVIRCDECTVFVWNEREQVLAPAVCDAHEWVEEMLAVRLRLGEGITGTVALTGIGEIVDDSETDPRAHRVPGTPPEHSSLLCVPLTARGRVLGVVTLARAGVNPFARADLDLATLFAGQCSAALANARMYEELRTAFDELRQTQAQLVQSAKLNALGEMAGGVAHDFNNILAAILGRAQLLLQGTADDEVRRQLAVIEQAALDGAQTVRRVQEFTRQRQDECFAALDVNQVMHDVVELTRPVWETGPERTGSAIEVHLRTQATWAIEGNASELREVFTNLVLNAVDAMPAGGDLDLATENVPGGIRVSVRDTGIGMDEPTRARIFDPFFTTKGHRGTGLGLSVAYGIVSRHHGSIEAESEPGHGTVFVLHFPACEAKEPPAEPVPASACERQRVLVVDDEPAVLEVLGDMLELLGMDVTRALGGAEGVRALESGTWDVVFTDLGMPEVSGWDVALAARARHPRATVVLVTGWGFQLEEDIAVARGVDRVLAKPFSWDDVQSVVRAPAGSRRAA